MAQLKRKFRENRALLPPLSFATILGMALFTVYIGSAVLSALPFHLQSSYDGVGALYTAAEEAAYCAANFPEADTCFAPSTTTNRTIYMQPYGGLGNRLRAIASALTLGKELNSNVVIVWMNKEHGFRGRWVDLFDSPRIPMGCFPGGALRDDHARCTVHRVNHHSEWEIVKNKFEKRGDQEVLCLQSMMFLTRKQRGIQWFYGLLRPAKAIADGIAAFQKKVYWDQWGQWIGVHVRRTDLRLLCNTEKCEDGFTATEVLPLSRYTDVLQQIIDMNRSSKEHLRFFLATDDPATETEIANVLASATNASHAEGSIVSFVKAVRDAASDSFAMRENAMGMAEAVADLWLLSRCQMLIGTVGSSYSQSAKLMGGPFYISAGVEYENRL